MTLLQQYKQLLQNGEIQENTEQLRVVKYLNQLHKDLEKRKARNQKAFRRLRHWLAQDNKLKGLYLWGDVGVGKTFLVDLFYSNLTTEKKTRQHFFEFMQHIHHSLKRLQGHKNPLQIIARHLSMKYRIICFDEFFVDDIADAMLLGELFKALFIRGTVMIATSNVVPDKLYKNGIQRERFLPAITAIKQHMQVMHLESGQDYRRQHVEQAGVYYTPLDKQAEQDLEHCFKHYSHGVEISSDAIELCQRQVPIVKQADGVIWFDFMTLCGTARSQDDYLALAKQYHTVIISNIPIIRDNQRDVIRRFINCIDVFYDAHIRVIISAATLPESLYPHGALHFEYQRTISRLIEMKDVNWIASR